MENLTLRKLINMFDLSDEIKKNGHSGYLVGAKLEINNTRRALGQCDLYHSIIKISRNVIEQKDGRTLQDLRETLVHELCHLFAFKECNDKGHGKAWKGLMAVYGYHCKNRFHGHPMSETVKKANDALEGKTLKELADIYNQKSLKKIAKFPDKKTAIRRVKEVMNTTHEILIHPKDYRKPVRKDTKVALVIEALYVGATEADVLAILGETKKTKATRAKFNHWMRWNINFDKGYGIAVKNVDGQETYFLVTDNDGDCVIQYNKLSAGEPKKD